MPALAEVPIYNNITRQPELGALLASWTGLSYTLTEGNRQETSPTIQSAACNQHCIDDRVFPVRPAL